MVSCEDDGGEKGRCAELARRKSISGRPVCHLALHLTPPLLTSTKQLSILTCKSSLQSSEPIFSESVMRCQGLRACFTLLARLTFLSHNCTRLSVAPSRLYAATWSHVIAFQIKEQLLSC